MNAGVLVAIIGALSAGFATVIGVLIARMNTKAQAALAAANRATEAASAQVATNAANHATDVTAGLAQQAANAAAFTQAKEFYENVINGYRAQVTDNERRISLLEHAQLDLATTHTEQVAELNATARSQAARILRLEELLRINDVDFTHLDDSTSTDR